MTNQYKNSDFPSHNIDPELKNGDWLLKAAKASWGASYDCPNIFYHNRDKYQVYRDYAYAKQSVEKYKASIGADEATDLSVMNVTLTPRPVLTKYMNIVTSKIMEVGRKAVATPIDGMAQDKADQYFADIRAKILMREALKQTNPELANSPNLMSEPGEPDSIEELEMQSQWGFKFNLAMESEQGIELIQYQNALPIKRLQVSKDLVHLGVGGYKDWLDENGKPMFRDVDPANVVISYCNKSDFSDKLYVGEITTSSIGELSKYFNEDDLLKIQTANSSNYTAGQRNYNQITRKLKAQVLDLEYKSWDDIVFSRGIDEAGNEQYKERAYVNMTNPERVKELSNMPDDNGGYKPKYFSKKVECWYKICWVIGTDLYYNAGKVSNQKRSKENLSESQSSYHLQAVNFSDMQAQGLVEGLIPIVDEYHNTAFKIQDFKNRWQPYIIEVDMDAIESVGMGKAGVAWTPEKVLDTAIKSRILMVRKRDISGINPNYKAIDIIQTGMASELQPLLMDMQRLLQEMNDVTGLNPVTDGTGSGERKLKATAQLDLQATNNALSPLMFAEKTLFESLSKGCMARLVQAVKMGKVEGIMTALGNNTVKFIRVSPDIALHTWGIKVQDIPTDDDIRVIMEQMGLAEQQQLLRPQDVLMIKSLDNLKQMEQRIGYLAEKRFKENQEYEKSKIQQTIDGQIKSSQETAIANQGTIQLEKDLELRNQLEIKKMDMELLKMKLDAERYNKEIDVQGKVHTADKAGDSKVIAQSIASESELHKAHIAGEKGKEKQYIANEKKESSAK